jgi:hypothetical protein
MSVAEFLTKYLQSNCYCQHWMTDSPSPRNLAWTHSGSLGRAIAQVVSRWLATAVQVRARVRSCGICGGQSGTGAGFLRVLWFPLPIIITPIAPQSPSSINWGWYNRPVSGRSTKWTQSHPL